MSRKSIKSPLIGLALAGLTALPAQAIDHSQASRWFQKIDADANGAISLREFLKKRGEQFAILDFDKNGSVSMDEYSNADAAAHRFLNLDRDGNSEVGFEEYLIPSRARFGQMDDNADGNISGSEMDLFRTRMRAKYTMRKRHADLRPPSTLRFTKLASLQHED